MPGFRVFSKKKEDETSIYLFFMKRVFTMFVLTVAAAEAAVGLAIIVIYYKNKRSIHVDQISSLKG